MDKEEDIKLKIFNTINMNKKIKKKYFRIEKNKKYSLKENKTKAIFKTKKDLLNRKTLREIENSKSNKNNKFITTTIDDTTASVQSDNSFLVQKIIPKKLIIKEYKNEPKTLLNNCFSNLNDTILFINKRKNFFHNLFEIENNENNSNNININNYKNKLMLVYFYSIKNLCKYINKNLFNISLKGKGNTVIDEYLYQIYQDLQILNRKINEFKFFENIKDNFKIKKEDFSDIESLKENLLLMKNKLNNSMSQNLINIYINIENFCKIYSS